MSLSTISFSLLIGSAVVFLFSQAANLLSFKKVAASKKSKPVAVSIIICARNEAANLLNHLPRLLEQSALEYEVIVVNDASWDATADILEEFKAKHPRLQLIHISEEQKRTEGKKMALTLAFKRAKYEHLLLTDADCVPESDRWCELMAGHLEKGMVLGYGGYEKAPGFLNTLIRYDTWSSSSNFLGAALRGRPFIGIGRNLAYSKEIYESAGGFKRHYHVQSGDDDLLVNQVASSDNCTVYIKSGTFTYTKAPVTWNAWLRKKTRHLSSSKLYRKNTLRMLGLQHGALIIFYLLLIISIVLGCAIWKVLMVYLGKTLIHVLISMPSMKKLKAADLVVLLPILEPLNLLVNGMATIRMRWSKTIPWK